MVNPPPPNTINWGLVGGISGIIMILIFIALFFMYRARKTPIMRMFGYTYFKFEILNPARKTQIVTRIVKDFNIVGNVILFKAPGGAYRVRDDSIFLRDGVPTSIYKFGNPNPINIYSVPDVLVKVYDEDNKNFVTNILSSQELLDAIQSKVVHDLNKFTFSRMEMLVLAVLVISLIINIVVVYEIVQVNGEFGTLVNQINNILSRLPTTTTSTPGA